MHDLRSKLPRQPIDQLNVIARRRPLSRARQAIAEGQLTVGFLGGSITAGWLDSWPTAVMGWFAEQFPNVVLAGENAAIGATGSDSACLRVDAEIIQTGCHLTFVEYVVNDFDKPSESRNRTREGLLRKLLSAGQDAALVYTYRMEMHAEMAEGVVPASIAEFERLGGHYGISSVWVGLHALNEVRAGRMQWSEWLPDGVHPGSRGCQSYAQPVIDLLSAELSGAAPAHPESRHVALPAPLFPLNWQSVSILPLQSVRTAGPWILKNRHCENHVTRMLETNTPGATLNFDFTGRGVVLIFEYGTKSAELRYRIDRGGWTTVTRELPGWGGVRGMVRALTITDSLETGHHLFEMETLRPDRAEVTGAECRLAVIGII